MTNPLKQELESFWDFYFHEDPSNPDMVYLRQRSTGKAVYYFDTNMDPYKLLYQLFKVGCEFDESDYEEGYNVGYRAAQLNIREALGASLYRDAEYEEPED